jgi:hypothetical protein
VKRLLSVLVLAGVVFAVSGCATSDPNRQSDIPWNAPQSWEGAPGIPGLENR